MDTLRRSVVKSVVWRFVGVLLLGGISYAFTRDWWESVEVTLTFNAIRVVLYVVHERIWERVAWGRVPDVLRNRPSAR